MCFVAPFAPTLLSVEAGWAMHVPLVCCACLCFLFVVCVCVPFASAGCLSWFVVCVFFPLCFVFVFFCFFVAFVPVPPGQSSSLVAPWLPRHAAGCSYTRRGRPGEVIDLAPRLCTCACFACVRTCALRNGPSCVLPVWYIM